MATRNRTEALHVAEALHAIEVKTSNRVASTAVLSAPAYTRTLPWFSWERYAGESRSSPDSPAVAPGTTKQEVRMYGMPLLCDGTLCLAVRSSISASPPARQIYCLPAESCRANPNTDIPLAVLSYVPNGSRLIYIAYECFRLTVEQEVCLRGRHCFGWPKDLV